MNPMIPQRGGFGLLDDVRQEFDSMLTRFFGRPEAFELEAKTQAWVPRMDVSETDKAIVVKADLPGVAPEDVDVSISNGVLSLCGERRQETNEEKENMRRTERFVGKFHRSIPLPDGCDAERITAESAKGVVTVTIPRKPSAQPRKIAVKNSG
jgi:HSP20 family protein